jgi:hypothetical protein
VVVVGAFSPPPPQPTANDSAAALPNIAIAILPCDFIGPDAPLVYATHLYPTSVRAKRQQATTQLFDASDAVC